MYYFAYGVNMNLEKKEEYCFGAEFISCCYLSNHLLIFDGQSIRRSGATANVQVALGYIVWGALFRITGQELQELDQFENYPISYMRKQIAVTTKDGHQYPYTYVYYREGQNEGMPGEEYFSELIAGAHMCNLPDAYIQDLESWYAEQIQENYP